MGWMSRFNWGRIVTSRSRLEVTTSLKTLCLSQRLFLLQAVWVMCSIPCVNLLPISRNLVLKFVVLVLPRIADRTGGIEVSKPKAEN